MKSAMLLELCALCPVEPACERRQVREYLAGLPAEARSQEVAGHPYRCWMLQLESDSAGSVKAADD